MNENFYRDIKPFTDASGVCEPRNYFAVPSDWFVVLTDVRGSTAAIKAGRYKEVNWIGAASIAAVLNAIGEREVPYVFGGDGAAFVVPPSMLDAIKKALLGVQQLGRSQFDLEMRVGAVTVAELIAAGAALNVARYAISKHISLAMFNGGGLEYVEALIKGENGKQYEFVSDDNASANFAGLECRWQPLQTTKGEVITALVKVLPRDSEKTQLVYRELIEEIETIAGGKETLNPVTSRSLKMILNPMQLRDEQKLYTAGRSNWYRIGKWLALWMTSLYGAVLISLGLRAHGTDFGQYTSDLKANTDFWKFDDMLRFVIDVTPAQKRALIACFDNRSRANEIVYGLHSSKEALMTCLVFNYHEQHVHFIDGADGGYCLAAIQLKARLKERALAS